MSAEERDILDRFERGELRSDPDPEHEVEIACQAARHTFNKTKRVNLRGTGRDFNLAHSRAMDERDTSSDTVVQRYQQVLVRPDDREEMGGIHDQTQAKAY